MMCTVTIVSANAAVEERMACSTQLVAVGLEYGWGSTFAPHVGGSRRFQL